MRIEELDASEVRRHAEELAALMQACWSDSEGRCYYPYKPFTRASGWRGEIAASVDTGDTRSWVMLDGERIVGHAALVKVWDGLWESGRWVVHPDYRGRGINTKLVEHTLVAACDPVIIGCSYYAGLSQRTSLHHGCFPVGLLPNKFTEHGTTWGEVVLLKLAWLRQIRLPHQLHESIRSLAELVVATSGKLITAREVPGSHGFEHLLIPGRGENSCLLMDIEYQERLLASGMRPAVLLPSGRGWKVLFTNESVSPILTDVRGQLTADLGVVPIHCPSELEGFIRGISEI